MSKVGSIGTLMPNLEARIIADGEGKEVTDAAEGEPGELWLRGPTIMKVSLLLFALRAVRFT